MKTGPGDPVALVADLYNRWRGQRALSIHPLPPSGSYRRYFRMTGKDGSTVMGVFNDDERENRAFVYLGKHLHQAGVNVPKIYETDLEKGTYLEEDLGDITLLDRIAGIFPLEDRDRLLTELYSEVIEAMPGLQVRACMELDFAQCYPRKEFDAQSIMWDLNYFKYNLLKPLKIRFYEQDLEEDFAAITGFLCDAPRESFMFRDMQSRNIMIHDSDLYFIDFQGGRKGPLQYDLASLLFESKARLGEEVRDNLLDHYLSLYARSFSWFRHKDFLRFYYGFVYLRLMQAMGAYGFRGLVEHKPLFLQSLPLALKLTGWLKEKHPFPVRLRCLPDVFDQLYGNREIMLHAEPHDRLTVTVKSFAYRSGIPADYSGHGGGFVFDCRSLDNPGRIGELQGFTGLDKPIMDFLSSRKDAADFLTHTCQIAGHAVDAYLHRGFKHLSVSFGCTGGRHRSVYMAERLGGYLKNNFPVNVVIHHTEIERPSGLYEAMQNNGNHST